MFVTNPCTHDARVMKEAKSLADNGFDVRVFALANSNYPEGVFKQENYSVHRLKFDNIFRRIQEVVRKVIRAILLPFHLLKIGVTWVVKKAFSLIWLTVLVMLGFLGVMFAPFSPTTSGKIKSIVKSQYSAFQDANSVINGSQNASSFTQTFNDKARKTRVGIYIFLKHRFTYKIRIRIQRVIFTLARTVFRIQRVIFTLARTVLWRLKVIRTTGLKARRLIMGKINRAIYLVFMPIHKSTTYFFFCKEAAQQAGEWEPQIAHAHDLNTLYAGKLVKEATGAKLIYDSHELWIHRNRVNRKARLETVLDKVVEKWLIRYADGIITVCDSIGNWLVDRYPDIPTPVILRNMPHRLDGISSMSQSLGERLGVPENSYTMIYTGKITSGRGIEIGLSVLNNFDKLHFVLLGYGETGYVAELKNYIKQSGIEERVIICDPVPHAEVASFISGADFALVYIEPICLSYEYALPNKLFESIQAGVPIMGSNLVEIEKVVVGHNIGSCFSSSSDFINTLKESLDDNKLTEWKRSIQRCQSELCWDVEQDNLIRLYEALAA